MADGEGQERQVLALPFGSRKIPRHERNWKKSVAKEKRNLGKEVVGRTVDPHVSAVCGILPYIRIICNYFFKC